MTEIAAKICIHLRLHILATETEPGSAMDQPKSLRQLFCSVYDLNARCAFMTDLPWTLDVEDAHGVIFDEASESSIDSL
jgi:hypothetical protein